MVEMTAEYKKKWDNIERTRKKLLKRIDGNKRALEELLVQRDNLIMSKEEEA